jgi:3-dehydroquinate synthetase
MGLCEGQGAERFIRHLKSVGLPSSIADIPGERPSVQALLEHMTHDKKAKDGRMTFVLVRGIGKAFTSSEVPMDQVQAVLAG